MYDNKEISVMRKIPLTDALDKIGVHWDHDNTFRPKRDKSTRLVLIENQGNYIEMLSTGPLFLLRERGSQKRIGKGRGAIDLVMELTGCSFPETVRLLRK